MVKVLVLNASYEPLNITTWKRATVLMLKGKAESLENNNQISIHKKIKLPSVIRLRNYIKVPFRTLPLNRKNIFARDQNTCQYCGYMGKNLSVDHVIPKSKGGDDSWDNVTTACIKCNSKKGNQTTQEANLKLLNKPYKPLMSVNFEVIRHVQSGSNVEWKKYIIAQ